jgi:uncharacterized metal-binding protein
MEMPELPQKKVGIVTCSGEELPEGTVTRLAARCVLDELRPGDTVTICLPLFLAGGEGDRAFAKYYPTIAIDGCEKRCAYHGTARYSNQPAASIVITDLEKQFELEKPEGRRHLNDAGKKAVQIAADELVKQVDILLEKYWSRSAGQFDQAVSTQEDSEVHEATCSCGLKLPAQKVKLGGQEMDIAGLPLILEYFREQQKVPSAATSKEMMNLIGIYNRLSPSIEADLLIEVDKLYKTYFQEKSK